MGIVKGLDHLHTALQKPIIHGNLKTNNIMLDADFHPRISDFDRTENLIYLPNTLRQRTELESFWLKLKLQGLKHIFGTR